MSTLAPDSVGSIAGQGIDVHALRSSGSLGKVAGWLAGPSAQQWLRRKAVAAWLNVLIAAAAVITTITAGFMAARQWPDPQTWGAGALKLFALWCLSFLPG